MEATESTIGNLNNQDGETSINELVEDVIFQEDLDLSLHEKIGNSDETHDTTSIENDDSSVGNNNHVRRSTRNPALAILEKKEVQKLLKKIRENDPSTVVLKIKDHILADVNSSVIDAIIEALHVNKVCQALYIQNFSKAIKDKQLVALMEVFEKKKIWCVNIGENYEVSMAQWQRFCDFLPHTYITHIYLSEHVITPQLKNDIRSRIRDNRPKHSLHCDIKNLDVISRCTHMWWNPMNGVKELRSWRCISDYLPNANSNAANSNNKGGSGVCSNPKDVRYWTAGGAGGGETWTFRCLCGERCSSYENYRYHPVGRMFQCTHCQCWAHVDCVLGPDMSDEDLEELPDVLCQACKTKLERIKRYQDKGEMLQELDIYAGGTTAVAVPVLVSVPEKSKDEKNSSSSSGNSRRRLSDPSASSSSSKKSRLALSSQEVVDGHWKFQCSCGETCSWYENERYHPQGRIFCCSDCSLWSHVRCIFGERTTDEQIAAMQDAWCSKCRSKNRRLSRNRDPVPAAIETNTISSSSEDIANQQDNDNDNNGDDHSSSVDQKSTDDYFK